MYKMKLNIKCPKCNSESIEITSGEGDPSPMYKCKKCGYKHNLFPKKWEQDKSE